jgi:hypothetical protein
VPIYQVGGGEDRAKVDIFESSIFVCNELQAQTAQIIEPEEL